MLGLGWNYALLNRLVNISANLRREGCYGCRPQRSLVDSTPVEQLVQNRNENKRKCATCKYERNIQATHVHVRLHADRRSIILALGNKSNGVRETLWLWLFVIEVNVFCLMLYVTLDSFNI